jgi:4-amino-4-deoxy-L-arabinose transferase-like glycosyltransferase
MTIHRRRILHFFFLILFAFAWFGNLNYRSLFQTDEGRYAEIPREMVATGHWLTPRLDGLRYFEKPPLQYWATAASFTLFGFHNWSARLYTALCGFACILLVFMTGRRLWGERVGWLSALATASSLYVVFMGHFNTLDMSLTFFLSLCLCAFLIAQTYDEHTPGHRYWTYAAWGASACALMTKGLIGIVFPAGTLFLYMLVNWDWSWLRRMHWWGGMTIFLIIGAPWFVWISLHNPQFPYYFFIYQHFVRYLTPAAHRTGPIYYFVLLFLAAVLPWLAETFKVIARDWRRSVSESGRFDAVQALWIYVVFIIVFFSFSQSKLPSYILPVMPAVGLLLGRELAKEGRRELRWPILISLVVGLGLVVMALTMPYYPVKPDLARYYRAAAVWLAAGGMIIIVAVAIAFRERQRERWTSTVAVLAVGWFLFGQAVNTGAQALAPIYSTQSFARRLRPWNKTNVPFYTVGTYQQSLPFYLRRTLTLVAYQGELHFGLVLARQHGRLGPSRYIPTLRAFRPVWERKRQAVMILKPSLYRRLEKQGWPMHLVDVSPRRYAVVRRTAARGA